MSRVLPSAAAALLLGLGAVSVRAAGEPAKPGDTITWVRTLAPAFEQAAKEKKPLMICINSERVDGGRVESAAKELRENTYKDPRVVGKSRLFVCAFLTSEGSSEDFGELRARWKIEGTIVSPQHLFARSDGSLLQREEYWPYGTGERSVTNLLRLMDEALAKDKVPALPPEPVTPSAPVPAAPAQPAPGGAAPAPPVLPTPIPGDDAEHAKWVAEMLRLVQQGPPESRKEALRRLLSEDKDNAHLKAILALLPQLVAAKDEPAQVDVVRALGRPNLTLAVPALVEYLDSKVEDLRGNAAISLEYIGAAEAVDGLKKRVDHEKIDLIACHVLRALGHCGKGDDKVRAILDRQATGAKVEAISCAAIVGLAYFEKDKDAARTLEDLASKVGPPAFGRRGWGGAATNSQKRSFLPWAIAEVGDPKSAKFMREKMLSQLENVQNPWVSGVRTYYGAVADVCDGKTDQKSAVEAGITGALQFFGGNPLMDDMRRGRDGGGFTPKADWEVTARAPPGGGGGQPPAPPGK